ncbi:uncharacterized protein LOC122920769 isoform X2 [Bufo gargarizans]|uniref:uncharacterized protein LOC122920769 isoform X2 n=1 Tax=Bufo gargarizans TaxID=30331 RepID=UPI001CF3C388|nr:uncharacterized protein LOC122920769 isoform X2 [Bufo gargarizans]
MERAKHKDEEPEVATGPELGPAGESPPKSGDLELDSSMLGIKEAAGESMKARTGPKKKRRRLPPVAKGTWRPVLGTECPLPSPPDKTLLEQYMNESLQQWFRLEFLMDYDYQGNQLHCMMCATALPSLSLTDVKHHILDNHPTSLQFSSSQKSVILDAWINRKENPEVEEDMTPDVDFQEDLTPEDLQEDMTPEMEAEEGMTPEAEEDDLDDDDDDDEAEEEFAKDDEVVEATTKPEPSNRMQKAKRFVDLMDKDKESVHDLRKSNINSCSAQLTKVEKPESTDLELLEEEEPVTEELVADDDLKARKKHLLKSQRIARELQNQQEKQKTKVEETHEARQGHLMEEGKSKTRERRLLKDEKNGERQLLEKQETARVASLLEEDQQKVKEAQLMEEKRKGKEAGLLEEEKTAMETQLTEEEKRKALETQLLGEEKNDKEAQEEEKRKAQKAQLLNEEKSKNREAQQLEEQMVKEAKRLEQEKPNEQHGNLKEVQGLTREVQNVDQEIHVKIEDHQYAELPKNEKERTQTTNHIQPEKITIHEKKLDGGKTLRSEPEKRVIKLQQVQQAPTVLGIGLPVLKMETPRPIIIAQVSVIPEHTIIQPPKPKPSTSDISKTWRVIAPKVSPTDLQKPPSASTETPQSPAGVDPTVWEVSVWRGNTINPIQSNTYQMRWRTEFMMDFNGVRGRVVCMYCSSTLSVLKESSLKRHIVQKHPHTLNFTAEEKAAVILDWENKLSEMKMMAENPNKEGLVIADPGLSIVKAPDCDPVEPEEEEPIWSGVLPEGKGASWEFAFGRLQGKVKDPRKYQHDRWKLEFLMDYTPAKDGLICMVCGATLMNPKISTVKMHIQQKHPDTTYLSDQEKAVVMEEWEQKMTAGKKEAGQQHNEDEICFEINEDSSTSETNGSSVAASSPHPEVILPTFSKTPKSTPSLPPPCNSAKRNYQVRWRTEFMMDYDCRRQGLICMVCGGTLATLKVSTIKRHIVQVHPYSLDFTAEERQRILEAYSEMALHYIHSEECFKTQPQEEAKGRKRKSTAMEES